MTSDTLRTERFPDPAAADAASRRPASPEVPARGALLRALLAGAAALLVLLLPAQLAASRGDDGWAGCRNAACPFGDRAALDSSSQWDNASRREISSDDTC